MGFYKNIGADPLYGDAQRDVWRQTLCDSIAQFSFLFETYTCAFLEREQIFVQGGCVASSMFCAIFPVVLEMPIELFGSSFFESLKNKCHEMEVLIFGFRKISA